MNATAAVQQWRTQSYPSGTHVVTDGSAGPWLSVRGTNPADRGDATRRYALCEDLAAFLNGGPRPSWLTVMDREHEDEIIGPDGMRITAVGPMYDANEPHSLWQERQDDAAKDARARLIDRLWLRSTNHGATTQAG